MLYVVKGSVITRPISVDNIEAGVVAVLRSYEFGKPEQILGIVTVDHINSNGSFVVTGDYSGVVKPYMDLNVLVVLEHQSNEEYPLKFNQWKKSIKANEVNTDKEVTFKLNPLKFVKGNYMRECVECTSQFIAHKRQPFCEECCNKNKTAQIILTKEKPKPVTKTRRKRMVSPSTAKLIAIEAYKKGLKNENYESVERWLDKSL